MREAGLRFSTLGTSRSGVAYRLYQRHGYVDMHVWATALARWETAHQPTRLRVQPPGPEGFDFIEKLFENIAGSYLGFAWRHTPFVRLRDRVSLDEIWVVWENKAPVGYVFARVEGSLLKLSIQLLRYGVDVVEAIAAVVSRVKAPYLQVTLSRPSDIAGFQRAGWQATRLRFLKIASCPTGYVPARAQHMKSAPFSSLGQS